VNIPEEKTFIEKARRAQIVEATINVLAELGYTNTSFAQIAKKSGISRGLISYHFKNKDDLMLQVVMEVFAGNMMYVNEQVAAQRSATQRLHTYIEANLTHMSQQPKRYLAMMEVVMNAKTNEGESIFKAISQADDDELGYTELEDIFRAGQAGGEFWDFDPRVMAIALRGAIDKVLGQLANHPRLELAHHIQQLCALFDHATKAETS
jgi:TetR/AcrR family fatty acid metabolism transcriptional regulator